MSRSLKMYGGEWMRERVYHATVARMRGGVRDGYWDCGRQAVDGALFKRLVRRVVYGGKKGRRAFSRLWCLGVRPRTLRVTIKIKGFELSAEQARAWTKLGMETR